MADRYWVGGTAAWDGTAGTKWALTSGGAGGQAVPTSADDVFFNAASGAVTCTISTGNTGAKSVTCTGFTGTLAGTANISVSGSVTLVAGMTFTYSGTLTIAATGTLTTAGKTLSSIILNASVTLGDALLTTTGAALTLNSGNFDLNGFTCSVGVFSSSGSGVRSIAFGAQNIALTATTPVSVTILGMAIATNFTFTGTGGFSRNSVQVSNIFFGSTSGATSTNAPNLFVVAGASGITFNTSHFKTINFTGSTCTISGLATLYSSPTLAAGGTYTGFTLSYTTTQTLTTSGKTIGALQVVGSGITLTLGGALTTATNGSVTLLNGTLDLNGFPMSTGSFISSGSLARSIVFGTQNIALTSTTAATTVLSMANMSGFSYTGTGGFTRNNTVTATASCGNNGGGSAANAPNLSITGGSATFSISTSVGPVGSFFNNLICTGFNGLLAVVPSSGIYVVNIAGSFTASNFTNNDVSPTFIGTGTLTTGATSILNVLIDATAGTITLGSALSCGSIVQNGGTFTTSNFNVTAFDISSGGVAAKVMNFGSSTITITFHRYPY